MTVIVDASVAIKWVMTEEGSDAAKRLVGEELLVAPELLFIECANVLWTKVRSGVLSQDLALAGLAVIDATPIRSVPVRPHLESAMRIGLQLGRTAYDALYLAVALSERSPFVTADRRFAAAAQAHPVYADAVRLLGA